MSRYNFARSALESANPQRIAILSGNTAVTYGDLFQEASEIAESLKAQVSSIFPRTPRIGLLSADGCDYIRLALGIMLSGGCFVPVPSEMPPGEREELIRETELDLLLNTVEDGWTIKGDWNTSVLDIASVAAVVRCHTPDKINEPQNEPFFSETNPVFIRFSSGTTGPSKGVILSHETLLERVQQAEKSLTLREDDRVLWILPMSYHFAASIMLYLWKQCTTVLCGSHMGDDVIREANTHRATILYASPFHYRLLNASKPAIEIPSLRLAVSTAAALDSHTAKQFLQRFKIPLTQALGLIELGLPVINLNFAFESPELIGNLVDGFEAKIEPVESKSANEGELLLRGPGMVDAYLNPWTPREDILEDGWFRTGDIANISASGALSLRGRRKAVINVCGMKVFPEEVERILSLHPQVKLARVRGKSSSRFGQIPVAEIVLGDPESKVSIDELTQHCSEYLSSYKIPLHYEFVDSIPLTNSGKVKRI